VYVYIIRALIISIAIAVRRARSEISVPNQIPYLPPHSFENFDLPKSYSSRRSLAKKRCTRVVQEMVDRFLFRVISTGGRPHVLRAVEIISTGSSPRRSRTTTRPGITNACCVDLKKEKRSKTIPFSVTVPEREFARSTIWRTDDRKHTLRLPGGHSTQTCRADRNRVSPSWRYSSSADHNGAYRDRPR